MSLSNRMQLSTTQQEIVCSILSQESLSGNNDLLLQERQQLLQLLMKRYEHGDIDTLKNSQKAKEYQAQLGLPDDSADADVFAVRTKLVTMHQLFTWSRLLLARLNKILSVINRGQGFLPRLFNLAGLSFGLELLIDIITIFYDVFQPDLAEYEKSLSDGERLLHRLKLAFADTDRLSRMTNDAIWFGINLTSFILFGPIALLINPIINISGNSFDVLHDGFFCWLNAAPLLDLSEKINQTIASNEASIQSLQITLDRAIATQYPTLTKRATVDDGIAKEVMRTHAPAKDNRLISDIRPKIAMLTHENTALKKLAPQVDARVDQSEKAAGRIVAGAVLILLGSLLAIIFHPVLPVAILGATLAFIGGCVMRGFGPTVYDKACCACQSIGEFFSPPPQLNPELTVTSAVKIEASYVAIKTKLQKNYQTSYCTVPNQQRLSQQKAHQIHQTSLSQQRVTSPSYDSDTENSGLQIGRMR